MIIARSSGGERTQQFGAARALREAELAAQSTQRDDEVDERMGERWPGNA